MLKPYPSPGHGRCVRTPGPRPLRSLLAAGLALLAVAAGVSTAPAEECVDCHPLNPKNVVWKSVHDPWKEKDCLSCHGEHGAKGALVLTEEGNALCSSCHETGEEEFGSAHRRMDVTKTSCLSCHHPHASEKMGLLRPDIHRPLAYGQCQDCHRESGALRAATVNLICFRCHEPRSYQGTSRHEPVASDGCTACHDPHGSPLPLLLKSAYPLERYMPFSEEIYALCFECHEVSSFTEPGGDADTAFKDSRNNLHYLHVVKRGTSSTGSVTREGTTCRNCHLPHAALRPRLIRENLDCGQGVLCLKLIFQIKDGVGSCNAGCHQAATYTSGKTAAAAAGPAPAKGAEGLLGSAPARPDPPCLNCHQKAWASYQKKNVHEPVRQKRCADCHMDHGKDNKLSLLAFESRLCARCHDPKKEAFLKAHQGYEVAGSRCGRCHDPHASDAADLLYPVAHEPYGDKSCGDCHEPDSKSWALTRPVNEICADCHDGQLNHTYLHGATTKQSCCGCHDPHAASRGKLVLDAVPGLCYRCHDRKLYLKEFRHDPVESGDCTVCHDVHGSERPNLFTNTYPMDRYQDYDSGQYQLCFSCHDDGPFRDPNSSDTAFRDGGRNLHSLHVNNLAVPSVGGKKRGPGYTCRNCHEPHSTEQPNLVRRVLDCGGVPCLSLDFKKVGESGQCSRGCHTPKSYTP